MRTKLLTPLKIVEPGRGRTLRLVWKDGLTADLDLTAFIDRFAHYAPLRDDAVFQAARLGPESFTVDFGDDVEVPSDQLRRAALEQAGLAMPAVEFREWRRRNGLSLTGAAEALGLNRRTVVYYESGEHVVPKTVMLACMGFEALQPA